METEQQPWRAGHFQPDDVIWRVQREAPLMLGGGRAFLMQAAHPRALAGFAQHSDYKRDPFDRLWRTLRTVWTGAFGDAEQATSAGRRVEAIHSKVRGELTEAAGPFPVGTHYAATDPDLLMWVHATLYDTSVLMYETLFRRLTPYEHEVFYDQMKAMARLFGTPDSVQPETAADFRTYMDDMLASETIVVCDLAREMGQVILNPPLPRWKRAGWPLLNSFTAALLPPKIRDGYGLQWGPGRERAFRTGVATMRRVVLPAMPRRWRHLPLAREGQRRCANTPPVGRATH